jgi:hypothetical protein
MERCKSDVGNKLDVTGAIKLAKFDFEPGMIISIDSFGKNTEGKLVYSITVKGNTGEVLKTLVLGKSRAERLFTLCELHLLVSTRSGV